MEIIRVLDPRLQFPTDHKILALSGASQLNSNQYPVNGVSDSSIVITLNPTSERVAVDSQIGLSMSFSVTINGTNTSVTQPLCPPSMVSPSYMPIRQVIVNEALQINGAQTSVANPHLIYPAIMSTYDGELSNGCTSGEYSMTPSFPDQSSHFLQLPASATSPKSPLAAIWDQSGTATPRGAFPGWTTVSNPVGGTSATFTLSCTEPLVVSPLAFGKGSFDAIAMANINNLQYNANLANLNRVVSLAFPLVGGVPTYTFLDASGVATITSVVVHVTRAELLVLNLSMALDVPRPDKMISGYYDVIDYNSSLQVPIAPGGTGVVRLGNQTLSSIPRCLYIWIPAFSDQLTQTSNPASCTYPIAFLPWVSAGGFAANPDFKALSVNFDNSLQCQTFTIMDLYKICKKNMTTSDFSEFVTMNQYPFSTGKGMCVKLLMGEDICLSDGLAVGTNGKFNLSVDVQFMNTTQVTSPNTILHVTAVYDGIEVVDKSTQTTFQQASFTQEQVQGTPLNADVKYQPHRGALLAGSFWDVLKSVASPLNDIVKSTGLVGNLIKNVPVVGNFASSAAKSLGYGRSRKPRRAGGAVSFDCDD